jgi:O-methyltransferase
MRPPKPPADADLAQRLAHAIAQGRLDQALADLLREALPTIEARADFANTVVGGLMARDHQRVFWGDRLMTLDKSAGFLDEPEFKSAFDAVLSDYPYDQYGGRQTIAWRLHTLVWAARRALALPAGDFVECGVFRGDMAWVVATVTRFGEIDRRFWLLDSFEGLDPALVTPAEQADNPGYVDFANRYYRLDGLHELVCERFASFPNVTVVRGFLPAALDTIELPQRIAYLHVDLNSARAEVECMERLWDRVVPGAAIVLDDYGWYALRAQKKAADAFFGARGHPVLELPTGQGLVVRT